MPKEQNLHKNSKQWSLKSFQVVKTPRCWEYGILAEGLEFLYSPLIFCPMYLLICILYNKSVNINIINSFEPLQQSIKPEKGVAGLLIYNCLVRSVDDNLRVASSIWNSRQSCVVGSLSCRVCINSRQLVRELS